MRQDVTGAVTPRPCQPAGSIRYEQAEPTHEEVARALIGRDARLFEEATGYAGRTLRGWRETERAEAFEDGANPGGVNPARLLTRFLYYCLNPGLRPRRPVSTVLAAILAVCREIVPLAAVLDPEASLDFADEVRLLAGGDVPPREDASGDPREPVAALLDGVASWAEVIAAARVALDDVHQRITPTDYRQWTERLQALRTDLHRIDRLMQGRTR